MFKEITRPWRHFKLTTRNKKRSNRNRLGVDKKPWEYPYFLSSSTQGLLWTVLLETLTPAVYLKPQLMFFFFFVCFYIFSLLQDIASRGIGIHIIQYIDCRHLQNLGQTSTGVKFEGIRFCARRSKTFLMLKSRWRDFKSIAFHTSSCWIRGKKKKKKNGVGETKKRHLSHPRRRTDEGMRSLRGGRKGFLQLEMFHEKKRQSKSC